MELTLSFHQREAGCSPTTRHESLLSLGLGQVPALLDPLWKPAAAPYKALDQPRPAARKSSLTQGKLTSPAVSSTHILNTVQKEERKSIFIKGWQRYMKEFAFCFWSFHLPLQRLGRILLSPLLPPSLGLLHTLSPLCAKSFTSPCFFKVTVALWANQA